MSVVWSGLGWGSDTRHAIRENTGTSQRALCGAATEPQQEPFDPRHPRACKRCGALTTTQPQENRMSTVTVTYTHAAPFIREHLVMAVTGAVNARTLRSRREHMGTAFGFATSLSIMASSGDQEPVEGFHTQESYNKRDLGYVARFLGSDDEFEKIMGIPAVEPVEYPWNVK